MHYTYISTSSHKIQNRWFIKNNINRRVTLLLKGQFFPSNFKIFFHAIRKRQLHIGTCANSIKQTLENSGNSKKFHTSVIMEETMDVLFCQMSCCWPFWIAVITKNYNNDYHWSVVQRLASNTKHHQVWINLHFKHVVGHLGSHLANHLGWQPLPKISKILPWLYYAIQKLAINTKHHKVWVNP